ncbi:SdrD B-like domain-containing protein [Fibrella aquatilis]|uniref:DUF11 domain-containing protein n=1 Tax=Fibrella aquatilis TaxID=2817059 RepID=A0A939K086_9BACT|nr:SdrD B-like domain-containing protein [Fibrella aquatilis]MBO0931736.1 DUF11 domain-containing protein [Fibrella aquatilis]
MKRNDIPSSIASQGFWHCVFLLLLTLLAGLVGISSIRAQSISGTVFRDYNSDGTYKPTDVASNAYPASVTYTYAEIGIPGVVVTAYPATGAPISATTNAAGVYSLAAPAGPYRVEFSFPASSGDRSSFHGTNSGTSVQFVQSPATTVDFALNYPTDYCQANPDLATNCYLFGDQVNGLNKDSDVLVSFPYNAGSRSIATNTGIYDSPASHSLVVSAKKIGATFGLAYARLTQRLFVGSYFKKHVGFGPGADGVASTTVALSADDPGAVYVVDPATSNVVQTFTVPNATSNQHDYTGFNRDKGDASWNAVGKSSLGGIAISDDETRLFVMNLEDRKLYALNTTTGAVLGSQSVPLALPGCPTAGDARPFAVETYRGKVYVGIVCSAESSSLTSDLQAYVYTADPTTLAFSSSPVFQFDLDYTRNKAASTGTALWQPWTSSFINIANSANRLIHPMPMLTSIAFDNGDMVIGLRDRISDIAGNNALDNPANATLYQARIAGDVLRASGNPVSGWTLENAGRSNGNGTSVTGTNQGPGGAEFYHGDSYPISSSVTGTTTYTALNALGVATTYNIIQGASTVGPTSFTNNPSGIQGFGLNHDEVSLGTVVQVPGFTDVVNAAYDPVLDNGGDGFHDAGVRWYNNTTGQWVQSYRLYAGDGTTQAGGEAQTNFGKGGGLGDLIALCAMPPIELGNRIWFDKNRDGIQNPDEQPIAGATVTLYDATGTNALGTAITNAKGEYYFSSVAQPGSTLSTSLTYNTNYKLVVTNLGSSSVVTSNSLALSSLSPVTPGESTSVNSGTSVRNNDATLIGGKPTISAQTAGPGASPANHTYDFGFAEVPPSYAISKTVSANRVEKGGTVTYTVSLTNTSTTQATSVVVTDAFSTSSGLSIIGSSTASSGTFVAAATGGTWTIPTLNGGQVATLSFQAQANQEGIAYNTATAPDGTTATVCTSIPAHVCANTTFQFDLTAPASYSTYQWSRNGVIIPGATSATYSATVAGEYTVAAVSNGGCPDGSCCPYIIVEDPAPSLTAVAVSASCVGQTPQANAAITLVGSSSAAVSYNITKGSSFTAATPLFATPQNLSAVVGGVLIGGQANPTVAQAYTIRVYSANGCFSDTVVTILPTICACPPPQCLPIVVKKVRSQVGP